MNDEDAMRRGVQFAEDSIKIIEARFGPRTAMAYAGAVACGARNYVAERQGTRAAFDLMSVLADSVLFPEIHSEKGGSV